jgi:hypothetical protein
MLAGLILPGGLPPHRSSMHGVGQCCMRCEGKPSKGSHQVAGAEPMQAHHARVSGGVANRML